MVPIFIGRGAPLLSMATHQPPGVWSHHQCSVSDSELLSGVRRLASTTFACALCFVGL